MKKQRSRNSEYVHIKEVLSAVIRNCRKESNTELSEIKKIWTAVLDKTTTDNAQPAALKGTTLLVLVKSSTLTHQLRFLANDIIDAINNEIGHHRITEIKLKIGNF